MTKPKSESYDGDLSRPFGDQGGTSTYVFKSLPAGPYNVDVAAYETSARTGEKLAVGSGSLKVRRGETTTSTIALRSTVTSLEVSAGTPSLPVGGTTTLKVAPKNEVDHIVMVAPSTVTWKSSDPSVATVDGTGLTPMVHALKKGNVKFTATFGEVETSNGQEPINSNPLNLEVQNSGHLYYIDSYSVDAPSGVPDQYSRIVRADLDGNSPQTVYVGGPYVVDAHDLAVSPDGSRIAFTQEVPDGDDSHRKALVVIDSGGTVVNRIAAPPGDDGIAFVAFGP